MKTPTNIELVNEAFLELQDVMDYIASEQGECYALKQLESVERTLATVILRYKEGN
jgi:hypothetical protein